MKKEKRIYTTIWIGRVGIYLLILMGFVLMLISSCKKDDENIPPVFTVADIDGNIYHTFTIGTQVWMVENLKTTRYNDGTAIPLVEDGTTWGSLSTPGYCWYNNQELANKSIYGALYNWYAVNTGKLCPKGWHVPTDAEWTTLATYLGGDSVSGGKLKVSGTTYWKLPNTAATNETGFAALPQGYRYINGAYSYIGYNSGWWSATENLSSDAWSRCMYFNFSNLGRSYFPKQVGFSVRCLQD